MNKSKWIVTIVLILLLLGAGGYWAYRQYDVKIPLITKEEPPLTLPLTATLTNREGKAIEAVIVGHSATEVFLTKPDDPKKTVYTVPILSLSDKDQRLLERVPVSDYRPPKPDSPALAARKKALEQLEAKLARLKGELATGGGSLKTANWGALKSKEISAVNAEIEKLKAEIKVLQSQESTAR